MVSFICKYGPYFLIRSHEVRSREERENLFLTLFKRSIFSVRLHQTLTWKILTWVGYIHNTDNIPNPSIECPYPGKPTYGWDKRGGRSVGVRPKISPSFQPSTCHTLTTNYDETRRVSVSVQLDTFDSLIHNDDTFPFY